MTETTAQMTDREISRTELKQQLVSFAREIGFDSCRIAPCGSAPHAEAFRNWLAESEHGEMGYMERGEEKRGDPQKVLPDARSIVVFALNYFHGNPQAGDRPAATGGIAAPHRLDARRCISYLTIELKGSIPLELRPLVGNRIFGCDDCLDACPWNRFAQVSRETAFSARPATVGMPLRDYLSLSDDEFRVLFRNSPIKRIKRRGLLRNVCVALGNVGDWSDLPALERATADSERLIAEHAKWAIHQIRSRLGISPTHPREKTKLIQGVIN